jgi:hypothetical protein
MRDIVYWLRGQEFVELAKLSIASVRKVYPTALVYVYTDDPENTPHIENTTRCELPSGRPAMVANLDAQLLHLNTGEYGSKVLFLDADVLLRKPIELGPVDVLVTYRHSVTGEGKDQLAALMPFNYGVVGAVVSAKTREAWTWMRAQVLNMSPTEQNWYGNQLALAALVGAPPESGSEVKTVPISWSLRDLGTPITVQQHPCETFNYTPQAEGEDVSGKFVLHFKGNRKQMMDAYA